jgi:hypothetical protein
MFAMRLVPIIECVNSQALRTFTSCSVPSGRRPTTRHHGRPSPRSATSFAIISGRRTAILRSTSVSIP